MNYIQDLQAQLAAQKAAFKAYDDGLTELKAYLHGAKFQTERWVNVDDVLLRLADARSHAIDAFFETTPSVPTTFEWSDSPATLAFHEGKHMKEQE